MITRRSAIVAGLSAASSALVYPKDFWLEKKPEEWTEKDIDKLMNHSPWSKEVYADLPTGGGMGSGGGRRGGRGGGGGMGGAIPSAESSSGMGGGDMSRGGPGGGEVGPEAQTRPQIKALVRWETAPPIRKAAKKDLPPDVKEHYVVSLSLPANGPRLFDAPPNPDGTMPDMATRRKVMSERLAQNTVLQRKGKDPIHPEHLMSGGDQNRTVILFLFSREGQPIQLEDKEVIFVSKLGPAEFKAKFTLKDMMYDGKLEL